MNRTGVILCLLGAGLIVVSAHSVGWRSGAIGGAAEGVGFRVGLLSVAVCVGGGDEGCRTFALGEVAGGGMPSFAQAYVTISLLTYGLGLAAGILLLAAAYYVPRSGLTRPARWAGFGAGGYLLGALMTAAAWTGLDSALAWSFYVAGGGALLGIVGAGYLIMPAEDTGDVELSSVLALVNARHADGPVSEYGPQPRRAGAEPAAPAPSGPPARDAMRYSLDQETYASAVDTATSRLRFAAREVELGEAGLVVHGDGPTRRVAWEDVTDAHAWTLPVDPPFEGRAMLDLATAGGRPVRLLPTTRVNYVSLPGGAGATSVESFRSLASHVVTRCGLEPSAELQGFLAGAKPARLSSVSEFRRYDARYHAAVRPEN